VSIRGTKAAAAVDCVDGFDVSLQALKLRKDEVRRDSITYTRV
jgi:hypothetical protein